MAPLFSKGGCKVNGITGTNFGYMDAMISDLRQTQGKILIQLFQVDKASVMTEAKPMKNIGPGSVPNIDIYI